MNPQNLEPKRLSNTSSLIWSDKEGQVGDITILRVGDDYHLFTEQIPPGPDGSFTHKTGERTVGHAISKDMFHWQRLPDAFGCGPAGSYDAWSIFHMDILIHDGLWYMFYTALDIQGVGQQQTVSLATSADGIHWEKHPQNPILQADLSYYEDSIPREATYQEKDFGRLWFRDPCIIRKEDGGWGMAVVARDRHMHPDRRGCLAWAESDDLIHWTCKPPIYSPDRFHTIETPSIFERDGRHYLIYMTHPLWCPHVEVSDPYQTSGDYYAISTQGVMGPYQPPEDEVVVAACSNRGPRMGAVRTIDIGQGERLLYGWLRTFADPDDEPCPIAHKHVVPPPRRVRFLDDGQMQIAYYEKIESFCSPVLNDFKDARQDSTCQVSPDFQNITITQPDGQGQLLLPGDHANFIFSVHLTFLQGQRGGLILRHANDSTGLQVIADRKQQRIEFGLLGSQTFIDARAWHPADHLELKVIALDYSIEVYANDQLMIHQVRYREKSGQVGVLAQQAKIAFSKPRLLLFNT